MQLLAISNLIGTRLRNYRIQQGLSQEKLAERAGLHPTYIGQLERGEKNATIDSILKVSTALDISLEQLFEKLSPSSFPRCPAAECYDLVHSRPAEEQKELLAILRSVIQYKDK